MPMQQSCGAGCDGQLRYGGSSRPSNILSPALGYNSSRMHYMRSGGGATVAGESSRSARCALNGGCGAFSASMAQLASSAQCNTRTKPLHSTGGGSSSGSHRLWSSTSTLHCSSPFHGPYAGSGALAAAGGFSRGLSSQFHGSCGVSGSLGGTAAAAGGLYCSGGILASTGGSRRGSCCSNVLPPQSHSHQIAKQLEQQQLEMEEAAACAGAPYLSQGHYQYHDCSKHHGGSESSYSHLLPEKLHDWVEVIKHPRSHGTQGTRIAVSSLHIGECPGVPENASSFAMKRTGTLKWQPGSVVEEDDDTCSAHSSIGSNSNSHNNSSSNSHNNSSSNSHSNSGRNGPNSSGSNSKDSSRSSSKNSNGSTGGSSLGLPRKVHHYLSSHEPKTESAFIVASVGPTAGSTAETGRKMGADGSRGTGGGCTTTVVAGQAAAASQSHAAFTSGSEKMRGNARGQDTAVSGLVTAAVVRSPVGTKGAIGPEGSAEETNGGDACKAGVSEAGTRYVDKEGEQVKKKKTLGFTKRTSTANVRKPSSSARLQRHQQNTNAKEDGWAVTGATCCAADVDGDGATTATGSGNSSGGSGGESDNSGPTLMVSPPSYASTLSSLSGRESDCPGSPRRRNTEPGVDDAAQADGFTPAVGSGGSEMKKNFSWHKLRQKLKL